MTNNANSADQIPEALAMLRMAKNNRPREVGVQLNKGAAMQNRDGNTTELTEDNNSNPTTDTSQADPVVDTQTNENPTGENQASTQDDPKVVILEKRYFDLKKLYDKEVTGVRAEIKELREQLAKGTAQPETPTDLTAFQEKYPDLFQKMEALIVHKLGQNDAKVKERLDIYEQTQQQIEFDKAKARLLAAHPDAATIPESVEFQAWLAKAPATIQKVADSYDVDDAIYVLDEYKKFVNRSAAQTKKKLEASLVVDTSDTSAETTIPKDKKIWLESEVAKLARAHPKGIPDAIMNEIKLARREGRYKVDTQ